MRGGRQQQAPWVAIRSTPRPYKSAHFVCDHMCFQDVVLRNSGSESTGTPLCSSSEAFQSAKPPSSKQNLRGPRN